MINVGGINANIHGAQQRLALARTSMQANFDAAVPAITPGVQYVKDGTTFVNDRTLVVGNYVVLPTDVGANAVTPTVAHLDVIGGFKLVIFRVANVSAIDLALKRVSCLSDDQSSAAAQAEVLATYGDIDHLLHYRLAAANANPPIRFLLATGALDTAARQMDPHLAVLPAAAAPPDPLNQIANVLNNQIDMASKAKENQTNTFEFNRFVSLARVHAPGTFLTALNVCMWGLPAGSPPSAGYFKTTTFLQTFRRIFYDYAQIASRDLVIADAKLNNFALLNFDSPKTIGFLDFATSEDKPVTIHTAPTLVSRTCGLIAVVYGATLAAAIVKCFRDLIDCQATHAPDLTLPSMFTILERRIYMLPSAPGVDASQPDDGFPPGPKLTAYFAVTYRDDDIHLACVNARQQAQLVVYAPPNNNNNSSAKRQRRVLPASLLPAAASTSRVTRSSAVRGPSAAAVAKPPIPVQAFSDWYKTLYSKFPALEGKLPCLRWLANVSPCNGSAVCMHKTKKPHVNDQVVQSHMQDILLWLKDDPAGRFT